jgi:hypothetical protein
MRREIACAGYAGHELLNYALCKRIEAMFYRFCCAVL